MARVIPTQGMGFFRISGGRAVLSVPTKPASRSVSYDAAADWSGTNGNPNGVWSYGEMPVGFGTFTAYTVFASSPFEQWRGASAEPLIFMGNSSTLAFGVPTGVLALHPGPDTRPSILRWTAPFQCKTVRLLGRFLPGDTGAVTVAIRRDSQTLFSGIGFLPFDVRVNSVNRGDSIDLCAYGVYLSGSTPLIVTVTATT